MLVSGESEGNSNSVVTFAVSALLAAMAFMVLAFGASSARATVAGEELNPEFNHVGLFVGTTVAGDSRELVVRPGDGDPVQINGEYTDSDGNFKVPEEGGLEFPPSVVDLDLLMLDGEFRLAEDGTGHYNAATGKMTMDLSLAWTLGVEDLEALSNEIGIPLGTGELRCEFSPLRVSFSTEAGWPAPGKNFVDKVGLTDGAIAGAWRSKPAVVATVGSQSVCNIIGGFLKPVGGIWLADSAETLNSMPAATSPAPSPADGSGSISGRVTSSTGEPLADICTYVFGSGDWDYRGYGYTNSNGEYTIRGLAARSYRIQFSDCGSHNVASEWYDDASGYESADPIVVTANEETSGIDAVLAKSASITGRVTNSTGDPLQDICVNASGPVSGLAFTNSDGEYVIQGLRAGEYRVQFSDCGGHNVAGEWYDDASDYESADPVAVTSGEETSGIDAVLTKGGSISGRVTSSSGQPLEDICVTAYGSSDSDYRGESYTDSDGEYTIGQLAQGSYRVYFSDCGGNNVLGEYYDDASSFEDADPVAVVSDQDTAGIDAVLAQNGSISGRVTSSTGDPLEDICVTAYGSSDWDYLGESYTDSNGEYTIPGLVEGNYRLRFSDCGGNDVLGEYYDDQANFEDADPVAVISGQATQGIDAVLTTMEGLEVRAEITWETDADLDFHVWDAEGNHAYYGDRYGIPGGRLSADVVPDSGDDTVKLEFYSDVDMAKPLGFCVYSFSGGSEPQTQVSYRLRQLDGSFTSGQISLGGRQWHSFGSVPEGSVDLTGRCENDSGGENSVLEVETVGGGQGTVTSSPEGIDCGSECSAAFSPFTQVTLNAEPEPGSTFAGWIVTPSDWGASCPGVGSCRVDMWQDRDVTAVFNPVGAVQPGQVSPNAPSLPGGGNVHINQQTDEGGRVFLTIPNSDVWSFPDSCLPLQLDIPLNPGAGTASNVAVRLGANTYPATEVSSNIWRVNIDCVQQGDLWLMYTLTEGGDSEQFVIPIGGITLIDPQGVVYDQDEFDAAKTAGKSDEEARALAAIPGATVRLQRLVGGEFVNVLSGDPGISPNVNPQITGEDGLYQWDVSEGTYRVVVSKEGYPTVTSDEVDIPPPVLDHHIAMTKPRPPKHDLTVGKSGSGSGTVTSLPAGIDCGSDCSESYDEGTSVTLTASPASGSTFTGWSGACSGTGTCEVTISEAKTVTAAFTTDSTPTPKYDLTVSKSGSGSGTVTSAPAGINCGSDCSESYDEGTSVTLTASPASGSTFTGWSGACSGNVSCQVTMSEARTVSAAFTQDSPLPPPPPPPPPGEAAFGSLKITPKAKTVKRGKKVTFKVQVRNIGDADASKVKVCGQAPKKLVKVAKCVNLGPIAAGTAKTAKITITVVKQAKKGKKASVTFTTTGQGVAKKTAKANVKVK